ncbi:MAG: hypothetical protein QW040_01275 [Candidatus Aenigmatarchaeota archaeon]
MFTPQYHLALIKEYIELDVAKISYLGTKEVMNRKCNLLKVEDVNRVMEVCLDEEYGVVLELITKMGIGESGESGTKTQLSFSFNATRLSFDIEETEVLPPVPIDKRRHRKINKARVLKNKKIVLFS